MLIIYVIIKSISGLKLNYFLLTFLIFLIFLTRPTSIPYIFAILTFIFITKTNIKYSKNFILISIFALIAFIPFLYSMVYFFMKVFLLEIPQSVFLIEMVEKGIIIHDRPETWVKFSNSFLNVALLYFLRFIYFFNPYAESFSTIHILLNMLQTLLIFFSICVLIFLKSEVKSFQKTTMLIIIISLSVAFFHSFTLIDFDWRYRVPIIMPMIMIIPISIESIFRKFKF